MLPPKDVPLTLFTREYCPASVKDLSTCRMVTSNLELPYKPHRYVRLWSALCSRLLPWPLAVLNTENEASDSFAAPVKTLVEAKRIITSA